MERRIRDFYLGFYKHHPEEKNLLRRGNLNFETGNRLQGTLKMVLSIGGQVIIFDDNLNPQAKISASKYLQKIPIIQAYSAKKVGKKDCLT